MTDTGKNLTKTGLMAISIGLITQGANILQAEPISGTVMVIVGLGMMFAKYTMTGNWYKK